MKKEEGGCRDSRRESDWEGATLQSPCMNGMAKDEAERSLEPEPPTEPHRGPNVDGLRGASWIVP